MPEKKFDLDVGPDGVIRSIYKDELNKFAADVGGELAQVCRLSHVEWEEIDGKKGWTIRAAHDPDLAIRDNDWTHDQLTEQYVCARTESGLKISVFPSRDEALTVEQNHYEELMPPKEKR